MWLIGMMGAGKSTVGRLASARLGVGFYDTDDEVERLAGQSIADLWSERGEDGFRELERRAVAAAPSGSVSSAGGGAVLDSRNRAIMERSRPVIWLQARPETLATRLAGANDRPILDSASSPIDELSRVLESRAPTYESLADVMIDTDGCQPEEIAREVVALWPA